MLIVFEGLDGVGKSTVVQGVLDALVPPAGAVEGGGAGPHPARRSSEL